MQMPNTIPVYRLTNLESRAASAENPSAEKGRGGMAAGGMKGSPAIKELADGRTEVLLDVAGPGMIRHIWCAAPRKQKPQDLRNLILRMYWEGCEVPSVEVPLGDFFGAANGIAVPMYSAMLVMQEGRAFNCYFPMPFSQHARVTITNETGADIDWFFYQVDFTLGDEVSEADGRFHARFRRENPCPLGDDFTIMETQGARGVYMGCVLGVRPLNRMWWGEGEVKIYLDGDSDYPTICGTGTEDYFGSAWGLDLHKIPYQGIPYHGTLYQCALYHGAPFVSQDFTSLYRFHVPDPIYFQDRIRVDIQQMGNSLKERLLPIYGDRLICSPKNHPKRPADDVFYLRSDDWCATAYWYQWPLAKVLPLFPGKNERSADLLKLSGEQKVVADL